jgi:hypothetical protein
MMECINPTLVEEGDLIAFVNGEADKPVNEHVSHCPACARKVKELRQTSQALLALIHRVYCPLPETLAQYQLNMLPSNEKLKIAAHVRLCSFCTRELEELGKQEDGLSEWIFQALQGVVHIIEAVRVSPARLHPIGVRGGKVERQAYHIEGMDILISSQPATPMRRELRLLGAIVQVEAVTSCRVWLFREGEKPIFALMDDLGMFTFEKIPPGKYDLALEWGDKAILLREVIVGEP